MHWFGIKLKSVALETVYQNSHKHDLWAQMVQTGLHDKLQRQRAFLHRLKELKTVEWIHFVTVLLTLDLSLLQFHRGHAPSPTGARGSTYNK